MRFTAGVCQSIVFFTKEPTMGKQYEFHDVAGIFPMMIGKDYDIFKEPLRIDPAARRHLLEVSDE